MILGSWGSMLKTGMPGNLVQCYRLAQSRVFFSPQQVYNFIYYLQYYESVSCMTTTTLEKPDIKIRKYSVLLFRLFIFFGLVGALGIPNRIGLADQPRMVLADAVVCESISNFRPVNPAVVFSVSQGEVFCFSEFDPVYEKTAIFHNWYKRDKLIFSMRLVLSVPKWSSFSRVQMRDADKGPWRVEIRDEDDTLLKTLRFSMSD